MTERFLSPGRKFPPFERDLESESLSGYWNQSPDKRPHLPAGSWSCLKEKGINNPFNKEHTLYFNFRGSPFHCGTTGGNANCLLTLLGEISIKTVWEKMCQLSHMIQNVYPVCRSSDTQYKMATQSVRTQLCDTKWLPSLWELSHIIQNGCPVCASSATWYEMVTLSLVPLHRPFSWYLPSPSSGFQDFFLP